MIRHKCLLRHKSQLVRWATIRWPNEPVSKFKKMLKALEIKDYDKASAEMLDSLWAKQTPNRAIKLSNQMKKC